MSVDRWLRMQTDTRILKGQLKYFITKGKRLTWQHNSHRLTGFTENYRRENNRDQDFRQEVDATNGSHGGGRRQNTKRSKHTKREHKHEGNKSKKWTQTTTDKQIPQIMKLRLEDRFLTSTVRKMCQKPTWFENIVEWLNVVYFTRHHFVFCIKFVNDVMHNLMNVARSHETC